MQSSTATRSAAAIGLLFCTNACSPPLYTSPGCRLDIYTLSNLQGYGLSITKDTPEFADVWRKTASSVKVIYGTWRLYTDHDYKGFMGDYTAPADILELRPARELESVQCIRPEPPPRRTVY